MDADYDFVLDASALFACFFRNRSFESGMHDDSDAIREGTSNHDVVRNFEEIGVKKPAIAEVELLFLIQFFDFILKLPTISEKMRQCVAAESAFANSVVRKEAHLPSVTLQQLKSQFVKLIQDAIPEEWASAYRTLDTAILAYGNELPIVTCEPELYDFWVQFGIELRQIQWP